MKKEVIKGKDKIFNETSNISTTPKDGFISEEKLYSSGLHDIPCKYYKGYSKIKTFSTNDPRVTRGFLNTFCKISITIAIILLLFKLWFIAIMILAISLFIFHKGNNDIDKISQELKAQGRNTTIDSIKEKEEIKEEIKNTLENAFDDISKNIFKN